MYLEVNSENADPWKETGVKDTKIKQFVHMFYVYMLYNLYTCFIICIHAL